MSDDCSTARTRGRADVSREVLAIGPYRFTGRDDITLHRAEGAARVEIHGSYATRRRRLGWGTS